MRRYVSLSALQKIRDDERCTNPFQVLKHYVLYFVWVSADNDSMRSSVEAMARQTNSIIMRCCCCFCFVFCVCELSLTARMQCHALFIVCFDINAALAFKQEVEEEKKRCSTLRRPPFRAIHKLWRVLYRFCAYVEM